MKRMLPCTLVLLLGLAGVCAGQDMRALQTEARRTKAELQEKIAAEKQAAEQEAQRIQRQIMADRQRLEQAVAQLEQKTAALSKTVAAEQEEYSRLQRRQAELQRTLAETDSVMRELVGVIRVNAKDIQALVDQNMQSALTDEHIALPKQVGGQNQFPSMADIEKMVAVLSRQIRTTGEVRIIRAPIIDRTGNAVEAELLQLGNFTAAYRNGKEIGFLNYSPTERKLFALSRLPDRRMQKQLAAYISAESDTVPMDISRGGALRQLTHRLSLWQQIPKGGPIVWPILAILAVALVIVAERIVFLLRKRTDADRLTGRIETLAADQDWQQCRQLCDTFGGKPVARVIAAGLTCCHMQREAMENALQEAILKEVPAMERFLSTLGILAAIAPLLGLLGTVTGMIDTFHVITLYGTGDPRMMSGGISEALVTTMLGLTVAIPIMLAHSLLNRVVDKRIGQLEEKSVALVNIIHKRRHADERYN